MYAICLHDLVIDTKNLNTGPLCGYKENDGSVPKWTLQSDHDENSPPHYYFYNLEHPNGTPVILGNELPVRMKCDLAISMKKRELDDASISDDFHRDFSSDWETYATETQMEPSVRLDRRKFIHAKVIELYAEDWEKFQEHLFFAILMPKPMRFVAKYADDISQFIDNAYADEISHHRPIRECSFCGFMSEQRMKRCACQDGFRCCSRECQAKDWERGA
jgi:hypothetical protein